MIALSLSLGGLVVCHCVHFEKNHIAKAGQVNMGKRTEIDDYTKDGKREAVLCIYVVSTTTDHSAKRGG